MSDERVVDCPPAAGGGENAPGSEESFAELFEKTVQIPERLAPGQRVKSRVVSISGGLVYIDLGGKSEGVIDLGEFTKEDGACTVQEGDEIDAAFVAVQDGVRKLTTLVHGYSSVKLNVIREAYSAGTPVSGEVKSEVKGGFEVFVDGVKCFCPFSQIDLRSRGNGSDTYLGRTFQFRILEFKGEGRNIILSRKALLEQERQEKIGKLKETLAVGTDVKVKIRSLQKFGAFADLGGIDGLIPLSEISWSRAESPERTLSPGMEVTARVLSLDWESTRITLSIKATLPDPWGVAAEKYPVGSKVQGVIARLVPFGAFVSLEPGIDGLVHISNLGTGKRINHPKEAVAVGQQVEAYVLAVDLPSRKISLSLQPKPEPKKVVYPAVGELIDGIVEKVMPFGVFLKMSSGVTGLIPNSEMGTPGGSDHSRMFPVGSEMKAVVMEVDAERGRVSLSRKEVLSKEEHDEFRRYKDSVRKDERSSGGLGRLGELLKTKMEEKNFTVN
ncbi:MAG TPA: S1 RNA-binding domain-containing protein [Dissulfurispiraceae bacterium]